MTQKIIGTCSLCGGDVVDGLPDWMTTGIGEPTRPTCQKCGATRKYPVIEMEILPDATNTYEPPTVAPHNPLDTYTGTPL